MGSRPAHSVSGPSRIGSLLFGAHLLNLQDCPLIKLTGLSVRRGRGKAYVSFLSHYSERSESASVDAKPTQPIFSLAASSGAPTHEANFHTLMLHGGFRVAGNEFESFMALCQTAASRMAPVEESLQTGNPCTLLTRAVRLLEHGQDLILCGQSLGATVAWTLTVRLETCGLNVRAIVSMDCRNDSITSLHRVSVAPRSLLQSIAPQHVRLSLVDVDFVAPLVPRGRLQARFQRKDAVAPWQASRLSPCWTRRLQDTDHFDIASSHSWDIQRFIEQCCIRRRRRCKKRRQRSGSWPTFALAVPGRGCVVSCLHECSKDTALRSKCQHGPTIRGLPSHVCHPKPRNDP